MIKLNSPDEFHSFKENLSKTIKKDELFISISNATCGQARGSKKIVEAFEKAADKLLKNKIKIKATGCHGFCEAEPNIIIFPKGIFYQHLKAEDIPEIVEKTIKGEVAEDFLYTDPVTNKKCVSIEDIPFYKKQQRVLLGDNPLIDPCSIEDYIFHGGYESFLKALEISPKDIIKEVKESGLRGRGGAGFWTGKKWKFIEKEKNPVKYIICNADEGDPGAYMDRNLLESNPHSILEGMIIGAFATGASEGWIYVRHEYPLAVKHITEAIVQAKKSGFLGKNILNSGFDFDINVFEGAGAFVCGEETALIHSIEGFRGVPKQRPPFPVQKGLFNKPTLINNVETWANIPQIIKKGGSWFSSIGTETSKGTKIFSLVGKVRNTGLVEVPMGTTLREIVYDIGGGIPDDKEFKAVQTGGPSGGCIPKDEMDLIVDYESLTKAGAIMGSGGMIVMDETTCMVDVAKYFLTFLQDESCGKCVPCREGIQRLLEIVTEITDGTCKENKLELLKELSIVVKDTSMCGLGQTAPNPVLSTLKYFMDEYIDHIDNKKCSAGVCKALITFEISPEECTGCGLCKRACPENAIEGKIKEVFTITQDKCIKCGMCYDVCNFNAVKIN